MIKSRNDLNSILLLDSRNYPHVRKSFSNFLYNIKQTPISDQTLIWQYIKTLRLAEYYTNNTDILSKICRLWYYRKLRKLSYKTGYQIPPNTIDGGLTIYHWGFIIINPAVRIGKNFTCEQGIVIGSKEDYGPVPIIGDNVTINGGARILGGIKIGNDVIIGANSIVIHDVPSHTIVAGIPAKIIKRRNPNSNKWEPVRKE